MKYWYIDSETSGELAGSKTAVGPFRTVSELKEYLRDDARETYLESDKSLQSCDGWDWAKPVLIMQEVERVQQCPVITVKVELRKPRVDK